MPKYGVVDIFCICSSKIPPSYPLISQHSPLHKAKRCCSTYFGYVPPLSTPSILTLLDNSRRTAYCTYATQISNFARPGFQSRHNRAYWENVPFLAFGNGAASYIAGKRFSRPRGLPEYSRWVDTLTREGWAAATDASYTEASVEGEEEGGRAVGSSVDEVLAEQVCVNEGDA